MHRLDDAGGAAHELDLARRLDRALPVDQRRRIHELGVRQMRLEQARQAALK